MILSLCNFMSKMKSTQLDKNSSTHYNIENADNTYKN